MSQANTAEQQAMRKAAILQAVSQLDMLIETFGDVPERVAKAAKEFRDSLEEWANA